jgi:hypothetical protein
MVAGSCSHQDGAPYSLECRYKGGILLERVRGFCRVDKGFVCSHLVRSHTFQKVRRGNISTSQYRPVLCNTDD